VNAAPTGSSNTWRFR